MRDRRRYSGFVSGLGVKVRLLGAGLMVAVLSVLLGGCAGGKYVFDVFPEMHYQPSYRAQEPPVRDLAPGEVSTSDGEPQLTQSEADSLPNPLAQKQGAVEQGAALFKVNCVPCHGQGAKGDGVVAPHFKAAGAQPPADLTSSDFQSDSEGSMYYTITNGLHDPTTMVGMPAFQHLLTSEERWQLVAYIRTLGGQ